MLLEINIQNFEIQNELIFDNSNCVLENYESSQF